TRKTNPNTVGHEQDKEKEEGKISAVSESCRVNEVFPLDETADVSLTEQTASALPSLHDFFAPGGVLSRSPLPYEFRRGQLEMAQAVERALQDQRHLIVEAGTGTGKTLAYLLPALRMCAATGHRVIISTGTKNLQEQLFFKIGR